MKSLYTFIFILFIHQIQAQTTPTNKLDTIKLSNSNTIIIVSEPLDEKGIPNDSLKKENKNINVTVINSTDKQTAPAKKAEKPKKVQYKEIGLNMTSLISQIAPFGNAIPLAGPTTIYLKKFTGNKAFRFGMALQASPDADLPNTIVRIGVEKRKGLNERWAFSRATEFIWASGSFNTPGFSFSGTTVGAGLSYGLEYILNKNISISTESTVYLGLGGNDNSIINFKIIPPIALFLNVKLYKQ